jgi:hypothetical protein
LVLEIANAQNFLPLEDVVMATCPSPLPDEAIRKSADCFSSQPEGCSEYGHNVGAATVSLFSQRYSHLLLSNGQFEVNSKTVTEA